MSIEERLEQLDEFINDEKNIVTYKWLSRKLDIDIKESKRLLSEYVKDRTRKSKCHVTYVLITQNGEGDIAFVLSKEHDLKMVKNEYGNIISQHIYSLQQNIPNDLNTLFIVDKQHDRGRFEPVIKYPSDNRVRVSKLVQKVVQSKEVPKISIVEKSSVIDDSGTKSEAKGIINKENELPKERSKVKEKKKVEIASVTSISKLFAKQSARQETVKKNVDQENTNEVSPKAKEELKEKPKSSENSIREISNEVKSTKSITEDTVVRDINKKRQKKDKKKTPKRKGQKERPKKHKRIVLLSDSSGEGEDEESDESEKEEVDDDVPKRELTPPPTVSEPACVVTYGKKRKRKVIEKTAADEEGFLHISKEVIYETCSSEDEETNNANKKQIKLDAQEQKKQEKVDENVVARNNGSLKTKQPSITSFFGKVRSQK